MKPAPEFAALEPEFMAHVKLVSERLGYSPRAKRGEPKRLRRYAIDEVVRVLGEADLNTAHLAPSPTTGPTPLGERLCAYLNHRSDVLENEVEPSLMNRESAAEEFEKLRTRLNPKCALPMNKQRGEKRHHAYLVGIINMLTEEALGGRGFDEDPRGLIVVTQDNELLRTFSRWMDGAYPSIRDPHAVWEVKEYYGTKTFGSRVADGVYETMLDGFEFAELHENENRKINHYLIVDDYFTWWECGRSYLCRIFDMLHAGLVDEALFGREVIKRWPQIVSTWP